MGRGLYNDEPQYRVHFDKCCDIVLDLASVDLRNEIFVQDGETVAEKPLSDPIVVQTAIFSSEYAVAMTLLDIGIKPIALVGHSIGEYAAAAVSGVLLLEDALQMVIMRAQTMQEKCEAGGMLSVLMSKAEAREYAATRENLWVACENSPTNQVLAGWHEVIDAAAADLGSREVRCTKLHVSHAFHSGMVAPAAEAIQKFAESIVMRPPSIPITSNVTGGWNNEPTAEYWAHHIVGTVKFSENITTVLKWTPKIIVECGPGSTLCSLAGKCCKGIAGAPMTVQTMRHPKAVDVADQECFTTMLGTLWTNGVAFDWQAYHSGENTLRAAIPTYCFEKISHWENPSASIYVPAEKISARKKAKAKKAAAATDARPPSDICIYYAERKSAPDVKVYCFPFAGGSSQMFASWARSAPDGVEVVAVEPVGRGARGGGADRSTTDGGDGAELKLVTDSIVQDAGPAPVIVFVGFSMGALNAVEAAVHIASPRIKHLFLAGRAPPGVGSPTPVGGSEASLDESLNLAPLEVVASEEWESYFKPMLLADLSADARADRRVAVLLAGPHPPLRASVDVFCGLSDESFPPAIAASWELVSSARPFDFHFFPGGHEFLKTSADAIFRRVLGSETLVAARRPAPLPAAVHAAAAGPPPALLHTVQWERPRAGPEGGASRPPRPSDHDALAGLVVLVPDSTTRELPTVTAEHVKAMATGTLVLSLLPPENLFGGGDDAAATSQWLEAETAVCWAVIQLFQQLTAAQAAGRLVVVAPASTTGALSIGASKTFSLEYPEAFVQRVFVAGGSAAGLAVAVEAAAAWPAETDILAELPATGRLRLLVPRLTAVPAAALVPDGARLDGFGPAAGAGGPSPAYIVSGGMGGVGTAVVDFLIDVQRVPAASIRILSRRAAPACGHPRGATIVSADVGDGDALLGHELLSAAAIGPEGVAGVFHLAGVLDDGLLQNMTRARLAAVVRPKAAGMLNLLRLVATRGWAVDWLVCFSSTSSLGACITVYACKCGRPSIMTAPITSDCFQCASMKWP